MILSKLSIIELVRVQGLRLRYPTCQKDVILRIYRELRAVFFFGSDVSYYASPSRCPSSELLTISKLTDLLAVVKAYLQRVRPSSLFQRNVRANRDQLSVARSRILHVEIDKVYSI